jgi:hypothetical protein
MKKLGQKTAKIFLLFFLSLNIVLILSVPVYSSQWYFAASAKNKYYFVNTEAISIHDTNITFWIMYMNIVTGKARSVKRCTIDCAVDIVAVSEVYKYGFNGTISGAASYTDNLEWYVVPTGSPTESIEKLLCSDGRPRRNIKEHLMRLFGEVKQPILP